MELRVPQSIMEQLVPVNRQSLTKGNHSLKLEVPGSAANGIYIIEVFSGNEKILNQKLIKQ